MRCRPEHLLSALAVLLPFRATGQQSIVLPADDRPLSVSLEDVFRIGQAEGEAWQEFARVDDLAFDDSGNLYVLDLASTHVVVVTPQGAHLRTLGKRGGGPGEFRIPSWIEWNNGSLVVGDAAASMLTRFGPNGQLAGTQPLTDVPPLSRSVVSYRDGGIAFYRSFGSRTTGTVPIYDGDVVTGRTRVLFEVPDPGSPQASWSTTSSSPSGGGTNVVRLTRPPVFTPDVRLAGARDTLFVVSGVEYRIDVVRPAGTVQLTRAIPPRPVREADRDAARDRTRKTIENRGGASIGGFTIQKPSREEVNNAIARIEFAEQLPAIVAVRADREGRIWVQRQGEVAYGEGPIDLISLSGAYLGTLPAMKLPLAFGPDGLAAWSEVDDVGVPHVIVRRIRPR